MHASTSGASLEFARTRVVPGRWPACSHSAVGTEGRKGRQQQHQQPQGQGCRIERASKASHLRSRSLSAFVSRLWHSPVNFSGREQSCNDFKRTQERQNPHPMVFLRRCVVLSLDSAVLHLIASFGCASTSSLFSSPLSFSPSPYRSGGCMLLTATASPAGVPLSRCESLLPCMHPHSWPPHCREQALAGNTVPSARACLLLFLRSHLCG